MIYMYNETQTPWAMETITPKLNKIGVTKTSKDGKTKKLSVLTSNDINIENLDELVNMSSVVTAYDGVSGVYYQKKDQSPVISGYSRYDKDILLISLNLDGSIIRDVTPGVQVINYLITKNQLDIVLSSSTANRDTDIEIVLYNKNTNIEKTYTFAYKAAGYYEVKSVIIEDIVIETDVPNYKFNKFRPAVITHCVLVHSDDVPELHNVIRKPEIFYINVFNNAEDLASLIEKLRSEKYRAVTLFMDTDNAKEIGGDTYTTIKNAFTNVNVLLNTDKVIRR